MKLERMQQLQYIVVGTWQWKPGFEKGAFSVELCYTKKLLLKGLSEYVAFQQIHKMGQSYK